MLPRFLFCMAVLGTIFSTACGDDNGPTAPDFDRAAMLSNYASNLIQPAYAELKTDMATLQNSLGSFADGSGATVADLQMVRAAWERAFLQWQTASPYSFGPADAAGTDGMLVDEIGTFPVDRVAIEANIADQVDNPDRTARGLLTIEYLLFGHNQTDEQIVEAYNTDVNRIDYLSLVTTDVLTRVTAVSEAWPNYVATFVANDGTDAGSSISMLYNEFVRSYERLKNLKVGLPAGRTAGQVTSAPELVESYYARLSLEAIDAHLATLENIYYGNSVFGASGPGLDDYLTAVVGGSDLLSLTEEQWDAVLAARNALPDDADLAQLVDIEDDRVDAFHIELQRHTRFFKSDLSSLLGLAITFASGDGD